MRPDEIRLFLHKIKNDDDVTCARRCYYQNSDWIVSLIVRRGTIDLLVLIPS